MCVPLGRHCKGTPFYETCNNALVINVEKTLIS